MADGTKGVDFVALSSTPETEPRAIATRRREITIQALGNLTLLSTGLNSAQSNLPWNRKRPEVMKHSLLPINQQLFRTEVCDEAAILTRGQELFKRALNLWQR